MNKHLPGRHNQKLHSARESSTAALWRDADYKVGYRNYINALAQIPGIATIYALNSSVKGIFGLVLTAGPKNNPHSIQLYFGGTPTNPSKSKNILTLQTDFYLESALKNGLGGVFYNNLLDQLEKVSAKAGFERLDSNSMDIPITAAAKRGYRLDSIGDDASKTFSIQAARDLSKAAYAYLNERYELPVPALTLASSLRDYYSMSDVLTTPHSLAPEVSLYTEFLITKTSEVGADDFDYNLNFHKDLWI